MPLVGTAERIDLFFLLASSRLLIALSPFLSVLLGISSFSLLSILTFGSCVLCGFPVRQRQPSRKLPGPSGCLCIGAAVRSSSHSLAAGSSGFGHSGAYEGRVRMRFIFCELRSLVCNRVLSFRRGASLFHAHDDLRRTCAWYGTRTSVVGRKTMQEPVVDSIRNCSRTRCNLYHAIGVPHLGSRSCRATVSSVSSRG